MTIDQKQTRTLQDDGQATPTPTFATDEARLQFAQAAFANIQELTRAIDGKANYLLSSVAFLTAALGIVAGALIGTTPEGAGQWALKVAGIALLLLYLLAAFGVIYSATKVYRAQAHSIRPDSASPGLIFPLILLRRHTVDGKPDEELYLRRLMEAGHKDLLHDYANQIIEVSNIYSAKQRQLNQCLDMFRLLSVLWVVAMLVVLVTIVWL